MLQTIENGPGCHEFSSESKKPQILAFIKQISNLRLSSTNRGNMIRMSPRCKTPKRREFTALHPPLFSRVFSNKQRPAILNAWWKYLHKKQSLLVTCAPVTINNARRIASTSPWLTNDTRSRIAEHSDAIAARTEKAVEKPMRSSRDYSNAYDKLGRELRKAGDLEQVAKGKKTIEEAEDGWDYDDLLQ